MEQRPISQLPWAASWEAFAREALASGPETACCVFAIDSAIPAQARSGYAALVIAYSRADEPVVILEDGSAVVLIKSGGTTSGEIMARRVLAQMSKLALDRTLRAGVAAVDDGDVDRALERARATAATADPGGISVAA